MLVNGLALMALSSYASVAPQLSKSVWLQGMSSCAWCCLGTDGSWHPWCWDCFSDDTSRSKPLINGMVLTFRVFHLSLKKVLFWCYLLCVNHYVNVHVHWYKYVSKYVMSLKYWNDAFFMWSILSRDWFPLCTLFTYLITFNDIRTDTRH